MLVRHRKLPSGLELNGEDDTTVDWQISLPSGAFGGHIRPAPGSTGWIIDGLDQIGDRLEPPASLLAIPRSGYATFDDAVLAIEDAIDSLQRQVDVSSGHHLKTQLDNWFVLQ